MGPYGYRATTARGATPRLPSSGVREILRTGKELITPTNQYMRDESEKMSREIPARLKHTLTRSVSPLAWLIPGVTREGLLRELEEERSEFGGFGPATMGVAGDAGESALTIALFSQALRGATSGGKHLKSGAGKVGDRLRSKLPPGGGGAEQEGIRQKIMAYFARRLPSTSPRQPSFSEWVNTPEAKAMEERIRQSVTRALEKGADPEKLRSHFAQMAKTGGKGYGYGRQAQIGALRKAMLEQLTNKTMYEQQMWLDPPTLNTDILRY